jgi:hypothetical protein
MIEMNQLLKIIIDHIGILIGAILVLTFIFDKIGMK